MTDNPANSNSSERHESGWLDRLAAKLGFASSIDARTVIEEALADNGSAAFSPAEHTMLKMALRFHELRVEDVHVPRANIVAVEDTATLADLMATFSRSGFSRVPVYRDSLDNPLGMVHVMDVMSWMCAQAEVREAGGPSLANANLGTTVAEAGIIREAIFAPPSMHALDLLARMQKRHIHLALVIDEHGGTDGLVTIEDLLEEVVGEIEDEHDASIPLIAEEAGGIVADARANIGEVEKKLGWPLLSENDEVDTLGGLVFTMLGRVPVRGEIVPGPAGLLFEILEADRRRVKKLKVHLPKDAEAPPEQPRTHAA